MRSLVILGLVAGTLFSSSAQASVETCAQTLLQSPGNVLYASLQVTPAQAQRIAWIRTSASQQSAQLQAQLDQVQAQLGGPVDIEQQALLESQQSSLLQQLGSVEATAEQSVINLLSPWQQSQCSDQAVVVAPAPVIVTYPVPRPVYRPVYRPVIVRPFPPRYPVVRPPVAPRYPVVVRPVPPRQPVMRPPVVRPPVITRGPVYRPTVIARAPAPAYRVRVR